MKTIDKERGDQAPARRPPVFHIRILRDLYGGQGITTEDLAAFTGMPPALIESYEACSFFPQVILDLVRFSAALQVPIEELIAGPRVNRIRETVALRRSERESGQRCREQ